MRRLVPLLSFSLAIAGLLTARPARADDDRFTLRIGAMQVGGDLGLDGAANVDGESYRFSSGRLDFDNRTVARVEGILHFSERNRLLFNYFRYHRERRYALDHDVTFGDITIPAGSAAKFGAQFDLGSLVYDYALVETQTVSFGVQIGAEWANLEGNVRASDGTNSFSSRESKTGAAPVVGLRLSANTPDHRWGFVVQGQYLNADWGNFNSYGGSLSRANALAEYRFTPNLGVYTGYDWFKLDIRRDFDVGRVGLALRFNGPTAGLTLAF
ncbi:MAG: hypothetical protein WB784_09065 [Rhodanobacteraceae bacterium]